MPSQVKPALLLAALALAAGAQAPDSSGWSAATWGMTLQEARTAFPAGRPVNPPEKDLGLLIRLESRPVQLGAYPATAKFEFQPNSDHLSAVSLIVDESRPRTEAFESLKQALTEKYGSPAASDAVNERNAFGSRSTTKTVQWRLRSSMILLTWFEYGDMGYVGVR